MTIKVTEMNFDESVENVIQALSRGEGAECDCTALTDERQAVFHDAINERISQMPNANRVQTIEVSSQEELDEVMARLRAGKTTIEELRSEQVRKSGGALNLDAVAPLDELAMARQRKLSALEVRAYLLHDTDTSQLPFSTVLTLDNYAVMIDRAITALIERRPVLIGLGLLPQELRDEVGEDMKAAAAQAEAGLLTNSFEATPDGKVTIDGKVVEPGNIGAALAASLQSRFGKDALGKDGALSASFRGAAEATEKLAAMRAEQAADTPLSGAAAQFDEFYAEMRERRLDAAEAEIAKEVHTDLAVKAAMGTAAILTMLERDPDSIMDRETLEGMLGDMMLAAVHSVNDIEEEHELEMPATAVIEYGHARDVSLLDEDQMDALINAQDDVLKNFTQTTDGAMWASAFLITMERSQESIILDTSFLMGWFANAIQAGRDAGIEQTRRHELQAAYDQGVKRGMFLASMDTARPEGATADGGTKHSPLNTSPTGAPMSGGKAPESETKATATPEPVAAG